MRLHHKAEIHDTPANALHAAKIRNLEAIRAGGLYLAVHPDDVERLIAAKDKPADLAWIIGADIFGQTIFTELD